MGVNYFQRSAAGASHEAGAGINDRRLVSLEIAERFGASLWPRRLTPPPQTHRGIGITRRREWDEGRIVPDLERRFCSMTLEDRAGRRVAIFRCPVPSAVDKTPLIAL